jgi:glycine/D-amino acid oxidase-like deaminating enzyme
MPGRGPGRRAPVLSRRRFLKSGVAWIGISAFGSPASRLLAGAPVPRRRRNRTRVAVIGAGAFGGWTALHLLRRGASVTLLDAWGPGNSRSSSGGETRVIRATYGPDRIYVEMAARSMAIWKENEKRWGRRLYRRTGVIWMAGEDDRYERAALPILREAGLACEDLDPAEAGRRYPQMDFVRVRWVLFEREAGYLLARRACQSVVDGFVSEGGEYRQAAAQPGTIAGGSMEPLRLADGTRLSADQYVFACGPWLGSVFPAVIGERIVPTRQEVFFFGTPAGDPRFTEDVLPVWIDNGARIFYGIPGNEHRGFKVADDTRGPRFDPTAGDRTPTADGIRSAREYLAVRFPALKEAPLLEARVCQYENAPDSHFIIDRHPQAGNAWIAGGGSGHGFKHGPAVGERVAEMVLGSRGPDPFFALSRLSDEGSAAGPGGPGRAG